MALEELFMRGRDADDPGLLMSGFGFGGGQESCELLVVVLVLD